MAGGLSKYDSLHYGYYIVAFFARILVLSSYQVFNYIILSPLKPLLNRLEQVSHSSEDSTVSSMLFTVHINEVIQLFTVYRRIDIEMETLC
jgi:hypothetical protein